jgi:diacylglycerol kinase (ATP)
LELGISHRASRNPLLSVPVDFLIIANPVSGARSAPQMATRVQALLKDSGASVELALTSARGDASRLAREAADQGVKTVVSCGGDGTLQEIAGAVEGSDTTVGILPFGRCNDFAHALGLHRSDSVETLAGVLLGGMTRRVDLGAFGQRRFLTVATLGFDSEVSRFVEDRKLWIKGTGAYLYGVVRVLMNFRSPLVRITGDFGKFEGRILLAATGNTPCYGGAMEIAPGANLGDGLFHVCLIEEVGKLEVLRMLPRVMRGTHVRHPAVKIVATRALEIETPEEPLWICADGETLGQTPCRFEIRPGALNILVRESG